MYIKGVPDYNREGEARETGLFAGAVTSGGELRETPSGKRYGSASVRAFSRKDGTAAFLTVKSFSESLASRIAALRKGDRILAAGVVERREYNGKTYTDMLADFVLALDGLQPRSTAPAAGGSDFPVLDLEDGELPF